VKTWFSSAFHPAMTFCALTCINVTSPASYRHVHIFGGFFRPEMREIEPTKLAVVKGDCPPTVFSHDPPVHQKARHARQPVQPLDHTPHPPERPARLATQRRPRPSCHPAPPARRLYAPCQASLNQCSLACSARTSAHSASNPRPPSLNKLIPLLAPTL
jgi:hypothetical protein